MRTYHVHTYVSHQSDVLLRYHRFYIMCLFSVRSGKFRSCQIGVRYFVATSCLAIHMSHVMRYMPVTHRMAGGMAGVGFSYNVRTQFETRCICNFSGASCDMVPSSGFVFTCVKISFL
jgi:hypothetical protein